MTEMLPEYHRLWVIRDEVNGDTFFSRNGEWRSLSDALLITSIDRSNYHPHGPYVFPLMPSNGRGSWERYTDALLRTGALSK